ncbi:MAG TPA: serine/threonine-protein kinase [Kofleriaceae bacterium]|nr:serine/threonine-protein kinase [Kofleriaceae bacterium]
MPAPQQAATASNRYRILGRIASGGMADIYVAHSTTEAGVDRFVVLKRVLAERARDEYFVTMFLDEARLSAQLQHPNIAQVHDVGQIEGTYFYTMEYVHGEDLRYVLHALWKKKQQLPIHLALFIASGALAALHHAHERTAPDGKSLEIVHRDVSPSNVMIGFEGAVKLLDFGVAKAAQRSSESLSGSLKGKVAYLSPEQIKGKGIDRRSDVFSLGIVLYEMLTGRRLYKRETDYTTLMAITTEDVPPPSKYQAEVSPALDRIVMTALEKDPEKRYPTAAAMLEEIEAVATAERHLLSATALARFMKEHVGVRPEPWIELREPEQAHPVTKTSSKTGGLQDQLAQAVDLRPIGRRPTETPVTGDPLQSTSMPQVETSRSSRPLVIAAIAVVVVGATAGILVTRHHRQTDETGNPPAPPAATEVPAVAPDAAAALPTTIAALAARSDWAGVLQACSATAQPTAEETASCALAACNTKQRDVAVRYFKAAAAADRATIERACAGHGVTLAKTPRPASKDPCKDPKYVEANPLKCM